MIINVRKVKGIYTQSLDLGLDAKTMYNNSPETEINHDGSGKILKPSFFSTTAFYVALFNVVFPDLLTLF